MNHTPIEAPVIIIGGGIMGCAAAYYLARRGVPALVLEKGDVAGQASGRNAGGVRAQCRDPRERRLALASLRLWEGLASELDADLEYVQCGNIRLAATHARLAQLTAEAEEERADGLPVEVWDRAELRRRAPYLSDIFAGAKYCPSDGVANPIRTTWALARAARRLGATILGRTEATDIEVQDGCVVGVAACQADSELYVETPQVIHAGGPWTPCLSRQVGLEIPMRPIRLLIAVTERMRPPFREFLSSHDLGVAARPARSGHVHISVFGEPEPTFSTDVSLPSLVDLHRAGQMVPRLASARLLRAWTGLLDVTPDEVPLIGPVDGLKGYLMAAGFSGHGFCLGPIVGKLLAEWVLDGAPSLALDAFRPDRFTGGEQAWSLGSGSSVIAGRLER